MNEIQCKSKVSEIISLDKIDEIRQNGVLSQKLTAVMPNGLNWLFYCPKHRAIPPYTGFSRLPVMVWLILQNKPIGEYVKRLLLTPRVRPHRPFTGNLLKNLTGVFS
ncbi:hypothetical protein [Moraxella bovis]|uniref:Uncharacterized protein n=1 Tax=Moraxella bovis TaxID=476 RepID=A0A2Z4R749_MORBO|nr:hypothetical protein [Moraxella bovis]AWY20063.1 hypothetical protein DQF64_05825 [Moraxella bovis]UYZ80144.1 hypothetical protein LP113_08795 [Moraxella bovis]UYZ90473.1 hypothetical protein LP114_05220 [Moraxella bovis]UYZ94342.1 hypothetical protein LP121_10730 [Moraxella bovis]UZA05202.1 hypothetical protein LP099_08485 [Moraxella bovis]